VSLALPEALFFTGIDWAAETHAVCVMDAGGKIAAEFTIEHSADGIATLIRRLARYGVPCGIPAAIERPKGCRRNPAGEFGYWGDTDLGNVVTLSDCAHRPVVR
jgi:hypothetical protein